MRCFIKIDPDWTDEEMKQAVLLVKDRSGCDLVCSLMAYINSNRVNNRIIYTSPTLIYTGSYYNHTGTELFLKPKLEELW